MNPEDETHTVELRDRDIQHIIKVLRFYTGRYRSVNNVTDGDVGFIVDTLVEARGEDLDKPIEPLSGEDSA
jgi:16S rRNA U1498 N3-methylase RsmE